MDTREDELRGAVAVRNEVLRIALQSHVSQGKAEPCACSQCLQIKQALADRSGVRFANEIREACALVADEVWYRLKGDEERGIFHQGRPSAIAREIGDRIRLLINATPSPFK